ncbi:hypothetical protein GX48_00308 [Paracoccidioides brasiliensis]|nr:hypothetical protein GX48_00308 [Paracoccidioides brasiliensis]
MGVRVEEIPSTLDAFQESERRGDNNDPGGDRDLNNSSDCSDDDDHVTRQLRKRRKLSAQSSSMSTEATGSDEVLQNLTGDSHGVPAVPQDNTVTSRSSDDIPVSGFLSSYLSRSRSPSQPVYVCPSEGNALLKKLKQGGVPWDEIAKRPWTYPSRLSRCVAAGIQRTTISRGPGRRTGSPGQNTGNVQKSMVEANESLSMRRLVLGEAPAQTPPSLAKYFILIVLEIAQKCRQVRPKRIIMNIEDATNCVVNFDWKGIKLRKDPLRKPRKRIREEWRNAPGKRKTTQAAESLRINSSSLSLQEV